MTVPQAIVLERNKFVIRRIARVLGCAGFETRTFEEPDKVDASVLEAANLVMADAFDADLIMKWLRTTRSSRPSSTPASRSIGCSAKRSRSRAWSRSWVARRSTCRRAKTTCCTSRGACSRRESAPFDAHLAWGASGFAYSLTDAKGRDHAVNETMAFAGKLGAPKRVGEMLGELAHELIMNALYDAPVDELGKPRFAHDRKAEIALGPEDAAVFRCGSDGVRIAVEIVDHFGRLERKHVFGGLVRGLKAGQMDTAGGGAGLGMLVSYRSTTALFYDVEPRLRTRVTGLFDLDLNLREFRLLPKTIHFPEGT